MNRALRWWRDRKHRKAGYRRVKGVARGRIYLSDGDQIEMAGPPIPVNGGNMPAASRPVGRISARVQRAGSDEWEELGVIADVEQGEP